MRPSFPPRPGARSPVGAVRPARGAPARRWLLALGILALLAAPPARAAGEAGPEAARAELSELAPRIERMKQEVAAGRLRAAELEPLLARAQALAAGIEAAMRAAPRLAAPSPAPDAQELREQADALRDQADKAAAALAGVERQLEALARRAHLAERLEALGASSDLLAEGVPGRARGAGSERGAAGTDGPQVGNTSPGTTTPGGSGGPTAPQALRAAAEHGPAGGGGGTADAEALRQLQAALRRELAGLRARIDALEAAARAER